MSMLTDLCDQAENQGVRRIIIVNGHGGNTAAVNAFLREWAQRGIPGTKGAEDRAFVCAVSSASRETLDVIPPREDHCHGDLYEALNALGTRPDLVRMHKLGVPESKKCAIEALCSKDISWVKAWHLSVPESAAGDITDINPEKAHEMMRVNAEALADIIVELCQSPWSSNYPYAG